MQGVTPVYPVVTAHTHTVMVVTVSPEKHLGVICSAKKRTPVNRCASGSLTLCPLSWPLISCYGWKTPEPAGTTGHRRCCLNIQGHITLEWGCLWTWRLQLQTKREKKNASRILISQRQAMPKEPRWLVSVIMRRNNQGKQNKAVIRNLHTAVSAKQKLTKPLKQLWPRKTCSRLSQRFISQTRGSGFLKKK